MRTLFWLLDPTPGTAPPAIDLVTPRLTDRGTVVKGTPDPGDARSARELRRHGLSTNHVHPCRPMPALRA
jgi:hypothetical protein